MYTHAPAAFCTVTAGSPAAAEAATAGAVRRPLELMVPALADHVTAELKAPVPCTLAVHCEVAPGLIVDGMHVALTEVTAEEGA